MIPANARELIDACLDNGWSILVQHGIDTGSSPYISVEAAKPTNRKIKVTWHTRNTGTYRLFSCMTGRPGMRDVTLKAALAFAREVAA
jgi:hypothetical protein